MSPCLFKSFLYEVYWVGCFFSAKADEIVAEV